MKKMILILAMFIMFIITTPAYALEIEGCWKSNPSKKTSILKIMCLKNDKFFINGLDGKRGYSYTKNENEYIFKIDGGFNITILHTGKNSILFKPNSTANGYEMTRITDEEAKGLWLNMP